MYEVIDDPVEIGKYQKVFEDIIQCGMERENIRFYEADVAYWSSELHLYSASFNHEENQEVKRYNCFGISKVRPKKFERVMNILFETGSSGILIKDGDKILVTHNGIINSCKKMFFWENYEGDKHDDEELALIGELPIIKLSNGEFTFDKTKCLDFQEKLSAFVKEVKRIKVIAKNNNQQIEEPSNIIAKRVKDIKNTNPWKNLRENNGNYIAKCDNDIFPKIENKFNFDFIPQPYVGNPYSSVVYFLLSNPNTLGGNYSVELQELQKKNLLHDDIEYPLFWIDPKFEDSKAYEWWNGKLSHLIKEFNRKIISQRVFAIDYYGYFSERIPNINITLLSHEYSFYLIEKAIDDGKIIIVARSANKWYNSLPILKKYKNTFKLNSPQNVIISSGNVGEENYKKIIKLLKESESRLIKGVGV